MDQHRIAQVARAAEFAFWQTVRTMLPEAQTDVNLDEWAREFGVCCRNAVRNWAALNVREGGDVKIVFPTVPDPTV